MRIIQVAGCTDSVENEIVLLSTTCDEDIDRRDIIANQSQLGSVSFLQDEE